MDLESDLEGYCGYLFGDLNYSRCTSPVFSYKSIGSALVAHKERNNYIYLYHHGEREKKKEITPKTAGKIPKRKGKTGKDA